MRRSAEAESNRMLHRLAARQRLHRAPELLALRLARIAGLRRNVRLVSASAVGRRIATLSARPKTLVYRG